MKGYEDRVENEAAMLRLASYRIHQSLVKDPLPIHEFWPLHSDKPRDTLKMTREMFQKIKERHKLK